MSTELSAEQLQQNWERAKYYCRETFTHKEFIGYVKCLNKIRVGDEVEVYTNQHFNADSIAINRSITTIRCTIIARQDLKLLLGRKERLAGMWSMNPEDGRWWDDMTDIHPQITDFHYAWWISDLTKIDCALIKRVIKK